MAEAPIQELSSANKIRELAGMPIETQPAPRQEEPPAWSEIKDSEDYKTLTYPEQVNLARQWGTETKQYAASLQDYTPEQDAQIDDFVSKDAVDVPAGVKAIAGLSGLAKGAGSTIGGVEGALLGGAGGMLIGGPVGAVVGAGIGGAGGALAGGEIVERGLNRLFPTKVPISEQLAPGYAKAGEYTIPVVTGAVGAKQLVQAGRTLFAELGAKRAAQEMLEKVGTAAASGAALGTGVRAITGQEITPGTVGQDAFYGALFAGLGSGTRVKGYNKEQAIALNEKVKSGKATRTEVNDRDSIAREIQRTGVTEAESAKRTTVNLAGRPVFEKTEIVSPKKQPMQQMPTAELPPVQPIPPVELAEAGVRGNVRGTQADTAEMQRRGIITPMQESLVDLNDPVPRTGVFTTESQGINREAIIPDTRGLQGEIVSEGPIVTPRTQLPSTERLALLGRKDEPSKSAIEAARTIELEKGMEERIRQSPQGRKGLRKDLEAVAVSEEGEPSKQYLSQIKRDYVSQGGNPLDVYAPERADLFTNELNKNLQSGLSQQEAILKATDTLEALPPETRPDGSISAGYAPTEEAINKGMIQPEALQAVRKAQAQGVLTVSSGFDKEKGVGFAVGRAKDGNVVRVEQKPTIIAPDEETANLVRQRIEKGPTRKPTIPRPMGGKAGEAGFIVSDVQEGAAKVAKKWLTTEGNLPKEMFDIMESKGSRTQAMLKQIDFTLKDLAKEARILNGKPRLTPEQSGQLDQFLRGTSDVTILPEPFQPIASQMRRQLDNLSEGLIQVGAFSQEVGPSGMSKADVIRERKGEYLTRSYEKFDNPKFNVDLLRKRDPAAYSVAEKFVRDQLKSIDPEITEDQVQGRIRELVEQGRDKPMESLIQASGIGKKLGITKARQDIPGQIRYLMGEYADPVINYARSASKMINLLQSQKQLNQLKDFGVANKLFFDKPTGTAVKQIAADGSDTRSPLNGLYAEPELVDAIENFEMMHKGGAMFQLYSMANAWVKWGKTVGSIQAQFRNPISNVLIEVANGNIAFGGNLKPIRTVLAEFGVPSMDTKEGRAYLTRATQLGIYDNTVLNEFTQMLKDAQQYKGSTMDFAEELAAKGVRSVGTGFGMIKRGAKTTIDTLNKTYRAGDNLFKLMAWENETKQLMDGRKISRQEAEVIGAERVKNTRPTYSRVPKLIKALRLQPIFGNFISWPSEMLRCLPNTVRYAAEDLKTPGMRKYGISRMMYMIAATTAVVGITKLGMWATDFTGRKMTALRRFVAPYQKNASLMPTGSDGKDVGYVDLSYTDPYEVMRGPFQAVMSGRNPEDSIYGAIKEFLESYIGPSILANSIVSAIYGKTPQGRSIRNPQDTFLDQRLDDISYLLRQNEPATVSQIRRIGYALTGQPDTSVSKYGRVYKPSEELSALFGIRPQSLNISKALESKASRFNTNMTDVGRIFTETYGAVGNVPESKIREQFSKMENRRRVMFDEANKDFHASIVLGLSRSEAISAMRVGGLSGDNASAIANNKYRDYRISKSLSKQMRRELSPEEMQKRQEIGRELMMQQGE
jgi:hypothetical protein